MKAGVEEDIVQRLTRLEWRCRWWQVVGAGMTALMALLVVLGATGASVREEALEVRAKAFVLLDAEGRPRMDLRVARTDNTHLVLLDREGLPRISLNVLTAGGADLVLRDALGLPRAALNVVPDGRPGLALYDASGTTRAALGLFPEGAARLVLYDARGQAHWFTPEPEGRPRAGP